MFSSLVTVALFAATLQGVAADPFQLYTPGSVTQCQDVDLSWSGGTAPFNLIVVPADDPCADPLQDLGDVNQWTMKWTPKIPAGQTVVISLIDTTGEETWSGEMTVGSGDNSCVPGNLPPASSSAPAPDTTTAASSSAASSSAAPTSTASATTTLTLSSSTPTPPKSGNTGNTGSSGSNPVGPVGAVGSDPLSSKNGASHQAAPVVLLGAFAAIAAFVL